MFHQARVDPRDRDALRFLWWPSGELHSTPEEYKMPVHIFGATSSPSCACFCLLRTAEDNKDTFPSEIVNTVETIFYVDDCLKSVRTRHDARLLVKMLTELLSRGGYKDYFMVGECVRFLFTSCEGSRKRTSERSERVSLTILHNE